LRETGNHSNSRLLKRVSRNTPAITKPIHLTESAEFEVFLFKRFALFFNFLFAGKQQEMFTVLFRNNSITVHQLATASKWSLAFSRKIFKIPLNVPITSLIASFLAP